MNILKKVSAAAVMLAAATATADLLYWQVSNAKGNELSGKQGQDINFSYATVKADGELLNVYNETVGNTGSTWAYAMEDDATSTEAAYVGVFQSDYVKSFLVELWDNNDTRVGWQSYSASAVANSIWKSDTPAASGGTPLTVTGVIPEPTSGLMLLLGAACLALRRRRRNLTSASSRAKAGLAAIVLSASAAFAAQNDALVTFSTKGPDKYADGKVVMDGECYALCWSKDFSQFAIKADGSAEGGELVLKAPVAKGGRCPAVTFQVAADKVAAKYAGGKWAVYLLDTRRFAADGSATVAGAAAKSVNTIGFVADASVGSGSLGSVAAGAAETSTVAADVQVPEPRITGIKIVDGNVYVSVKGTVPFLSYALAEGATPDAVTETVGEAASGKVSAEDEVILVAPAKEGGAFLKVK